MYVSLLVLAALLFATGGIFMKAAAGLTRFWESLAVFVFFCCGAACQTLAMKKAQMGVVYVLVLGLEAIAAFLLSMFILHEKASWPKLAAVLLIVSGIGILERA